jgi:serine-aspartate repeat-containing protein C/D/E
MRLEAMEPRMLMFADPIWVGGVYIEEDTGGDWQPDTFYITFKGGAPGTQLTRLVIDGDQYEPGLGRGDMIFDTIKGGLGTDLAHPFEIVKFVTANPNATVKATVEDGSTRLVLEFTNFQAGDLLVFSIDVDEIEEWDPAETDLQRINDGIDPIASGVEFQGTQFIAEFRAPHFHDISGNSRFVNRYDPVFAPSGLPLPEDNFQDMRDRTAGAAFNVQQTPKPVSLGGIVYVDNNYNLVLDAGEQRLANVELELFRRVGNDYVSTGFKTTTDAQGNYHFGTELNLLPGIYQVRQTQPDGYFSVGATVGLLDGKPVGQTVTGNLDWLTNIDIPLGDQHATLLNFAEAQPSSLAGRVTIVRNGFGCHDPHATVEPLAGVTVQLRDATGAVIATRITDADGRYRFDNLRAGNYTITEITPPGVLEGDAQVGTIGSTRVGTATHGSEISQIIVWGGNHGINYDFCELAPSDLSGHVYVDANNNGVRDTGEAPIPNTLVILWDDAGVKIAETRTDAQGRYRFDNLRPGTYRVTQIQPEGYLPGRASAGTIRGQRVGNTDATGNLISQVRIPSGVSGIDYDFGELLPGSISGRVVIDRDGDCVGEAHGATPIPGVKIELIDRFGIVLQTTFTDSQGRYNFGDLTPGEYAVRQTQPEGYFQGGQHAGSGGGDASQQDIISRIMVASGQQLVHYNFCELLPGSIAGQVFVDLNFNCIRDPDEQPLAGVTVELLTATGIVITTTQTNAQGQYAFTNLRPGNYTVRQIQPAGYFHGGQIAPATGGDDSLTDVISSIIVKSGDAIREANFCEVPPATISGYVFQDGPVIITNTPASQLDVASVRDGQRKPGDIPLAGVRLQLRAINGILVGADRALPGTYSGQFIEVVTDANGYFEFSGLRSGTYHIYQSQPEGYVDGLDSPGSTGGFSINKNHLSTSPLFEMTLMSLQADAATNPGFDAILLVSVNPGEHSFQNNFSEVLIDKPIEPAPPITPPQTPFPKIYVNPDLHPGYWPPGWEPLAWSPLPLIVGTGRVEALTWHLSVINGGYPRSRHDGQPLRNEEIARTSKVLDVYAWQARGLKESTWQIVSTNPARRESLSRMVFDIPGAKPLTGDFNGDGVDELALYIDGEWFIDLNGNGRWDEDDLWIKLGTQDDQPVVGDWDGDGKDDVGVFGREWFGDDRALAAETGLPGSENIRRVKAKNVPPRPEDAPEEPRLLKHSHSGHARADVIDHVFRFGTRRDIAVSGDFNGDGISTLGIFREGRWMLDVDGDGLFISGRDKDITFGAPGDLPLVGDFDGDGIDDLAILRGNQVIVDSNGNGRIDATDQVFLLEEGEGTVIVGDFDGDGRDEPALHQNSSQRRLLEARRR